MDIARKDLDDKELEDEEETLKTIPFKVERDAETISSGYLRPDYNCYHVGAIGSL